MSYLMDHKLREEMEIATQAAADELKCDVKLWRIGDEYEMVVDGVDLGVGSVVFTGYYTEGLGDLR